MLTDMDVDFAAVAKYLASPARAAMVGHLLEGRALTASELARAAGVRPSTASEHLAQLVAGGLLTVTNQGRNRYFSIANIETAEALESLACICPRITSRSLTGSREDEAQRLARICYDHVAGRLGVAILDGLLAASWLVADDSGLTVTAHGERGLRRLGVDLGSVRSQRRSFARACMDWTERRPHLAGALGASLAAALLDRRWVERRARRRGLRITPAGSAGLGSLLGVYVPGSAERAS
jgi:DNA-binding transcriptional ArsR family regulator